MRKDILLLLFFLIGCWAILGFIKPQGPKPLMKLSEYGFFRGALSGQIPSEGVIPYDLNTPLFTDYAEKLRFVQLPEGASVAYNDSMVLDFPVGTRIAKTFFYYQDARKPEKGRTLIETRVLIHEQDGWKAWPYVWNAEQTEAYLEVAGEMREMTIIPRDGKKRKFTYAVPNVNQCKGCHSYDGAFAPIGPSARQLNGNYSYASGAKNQIQYWAETGALQGLPTDHGSIPRLADWDDPADPLDARARAWLEINCAHCHNAKGPASTSGLFLEAHQSDSTAWGWYKAPVAAGRGSGELQYDILPGKADKSILYYRINSVDPGIMMPELGRGLIHEEGVALIREWINGMEEGGSR